VPNSNSNCNGGGSEGGGEEPGCADSMGERVQYGQRGPRIRRPRVLAPVRQSAAALRASTLLPRTGISPLLGAECADFAAG